MTPVKERTSELTSFSNTTFARPLGRERGSFTWVYLWSAPVRATHWAAAASVIVLLVTGYYIGRPYFMTSGEASSHFLMGRVRFLHFVAASVFVTAGLVRTYWFFVGNRFERFSALLPVTGTSFRNLGRVARAYFTLDHERMPNYVGHNPLQQWWYTLLYVVGIVMIVTGFSMYGQSNPTGMIYKVFDWVPFVFGGLQRIRFIHHATSWVLVLYIIFHVYLSVRSDYVERGGVVSSIITGGRYIPTDRDYVDYDIESVPAQQWPSEGSPETRRTP